MKKILGIFAVVAFLAVSCGPSAKELEEKRIADSIYVADSISLVQELADSIAKMDSIKTADSIAKLDVKKKK